MTKFYLQLVLKRLIRNKLYTIFNIASLSVAIAIVFFLLNYIVHELKTDRFHKNKKQIVRIIEHNSDYPDIQVPTILAPTINEQIPAVTNFVRIQHYRGSESFEIQDVKANTIESNIYNNLLYTDQSFFDVFTFPIIQGSITQFDNATNPLVISKRKADKLFGSANPIGQTLTFELFGNSGKKTPVLYTVVAVMRDIPSVSSIKADYISNLYGKTYNHWGYGSVETYLQLQANYNKAELERGIAEIHYSNYGSKHAESPEYSRWKVQSLIDKHFHSENIRRESTGSLSFIRILCVIAILILCVAFFNYLLINLSLSLKRMNTQIILNFNGATKKSLLILESIYIFTHIILSLLIAIPLAKLIHSYYGVYLGNHQFILYETFGLFVTVLILILFISYVLAIAINAFFTKTIQYFQNSSSVNLKKQHSLSGYFIIGQIMIFTGLLMSSFVLLKQMDFIQKKDPGYDLNNTFIINLDVTNDTKIASFKNEIAKSPLITSMAHGVGLPYSYETLTAVTVDGDPNQQIAAEVKQGDSKYITTYGIQLQEGRNLDPLKDIQSFNDFFEQDDNIIEVLVNESFAKSLPNDHVIGTFISFKLVKKAQIVGVLKDFHTSSYYKPIQPTIIAYNMASVTGNFVIKYLPGHYFEAEKFVNETFTKVFPDQYNHHKRYKATELYQKDMDRTKLISGLTIVTILISLLGIVGWSLLTIGNKTKEIGIRKVNGAKVFDLLTLINKDFIRWVIIASLISAPVIFYIMNKWLENFAYKITLSWWIFALAGTTTLVIALITVSIQSWRAATRNPVEVLRYE